MGETPEVRQKEKVSIRKLLRTLVESYVDGPVYIVRYIDPLVIERVQDPDKYSMPKRECIGWLDTSNDEELTNRFDRPINTIRDGKEPAGASFYKIPKRCILDVRRTTSP